MLFSDAELGMHRRDPSAAVFGKQRSPKTLSMRLKNAAANRRTFRIG
jgi:hypothetical protein